MRVAGIAGPSGAGKTTLIVALIERYVHEGLRVAAIKHTHHPLNAENRGDTARFRAAGAEPVILAADEEAMIFNANGVTRVAYERPRDLLAHCNVDIVLVEGFKQTEEWPVMAVAAAARPAAAEVAANLDRIWRSS